MVREEETLRSAVLRVLQIELGEHTVDDVRDGTVRIWKNHAIGAGPLAHQWRGDTYKEAWKEGCDGGLRWKVLYEAVP